MERLSFHSQRYTAFGMPKPSKLRFARALKVFADALLQPAGPVESKKLIRKVMRCTTDALSR